MIRQIYLFITINILIVFALYDMFPRDQRTPQYILLHSTVSQLKTMCVDAHTKKIDCQQSSEIIANVIISTANEYCSKYTQDKYADCFYKTITRSISKFHKQ